MDAKDLSMYDSIWYMCKVCKICLEQYEAMEEHITRNHDEENVPDYPDAETESQKIINPGESIPTTDESATVCTANSANPTQQATKQKQHSSRKRRIKVSVNDTNKKQRKKRRNLQHKKSSKFTCEKCLSMFSNKWQLAIHVRTHTGERPFHCNQCEKSFTQVTNLNNHLRIHSGDKPFKCKYCSKNFTQVTNLNYHERLHTGEMPYKCEHCGKKFAQVANLSSHVRKRHSKEACGKS